MKKYLLSALCLLLSSQVWAQAETFTESFEATFFGVPAGWAGVGNSNQWSRQTNGTQPTCSPYSGTAMYRFNTQFGITQTVSTPKIDWSKRGTNNTYFSFYMYRDSQNTNADSLSIFLNTSRSLTGATWIGGVARYAYAQYPDSVSEGWKRYSFAIPGSFTGTENYIMMRGNAARGFRIFIDSVEWEGYPTYCAGKPTAGSISTNPKLICTNQGSAQFTLSGMSTGSGITYTWQYADSLTGAWTTVNTPNTQWQSGNINRSLYFRCIVSCDKSGESDTSDAYFLFVDVNGEITGPNFTVAPANTTLCAGADPVGIKLTISDGRSMTYSWTPTDGIQEVSADSVLAKPSVTTVYQIVGVDSMGCSTTRQARVTIDPGPNVTITAGDTNVCEGSSVTLTANGFGFGITYEWSTGETTRTINFTSTGSDTVFVTAKSGAGCSRTASQLINTVKKPMADMTYTQFDDSFNFFNASKNSNGGVEWYYGDGNESRQNNPIYNYGKAGGFTVTLVAKNPPCAPDTAYFDVEAMLTNSNIDFSLPGVAVAPNPTQDQVWVELAEPALGVRYALFSIDGRLQFMGDEHHQTERFSVDMSAQKPGLYLLWIEADGRQGAYRVQKM
jgi:hypothetical protein